jgi:hypothetical protein
MFYLLKHKHSWALHCKKKVSDIPVLSWDVTNQTLPGRELSNYSRPWRVWLVTSQLGTGKTVNFCYSVVDYSVIGAIAIFMRVHYRGVYLTRI